GVSTELSDLTVVATELTVGDLGPNAMPATLPPNSGYTYAAEFTARGIDADRVEFHNAQDSTELPRLFLENFVGFPVGVDVPTGAYDRSDGVWSPAPSGRVIGVLRNDGSGFELDTKGTGMPDPAAEHALGITDDERAALR